MKSNLFTFVFILTCAVCIYFSCAEDTILDRWNNFKMSELFDKKASLKRNLKNFSRWEDHPRWKDLKDIPEPSPLRKNMFKSVYDE